MSSTGGGESVLTCGVRGVGSPVDPWASGSNSFAAGNGSGSAELDSSAARATSAARALLLPVLEVDRLGADECSVAACRDSDTVFAGCAAGADFAQRPEFDAVGDDGTSDAGRLGIVPGIVGRGGALAAGGGAAAGAGRAGGTVGIADFATGFIGVAVRAGVAVVGLGAGRLSAAAGAIAAEPGFTGAVGRAVGVPAVVGLADRVGVTADPDALDNVGEAPPIADAVGAVAEGRPDVAVALGRAAPDGGTGSREAAPEEEVGFAVADDVLLAAAAASATPDGFRAAGADEAADGPADIAGGDEAVPMAAAVEPAAAAADAPGVSPVEPLVEPGGALAELESAAAEPVVAVEPVAPGFDGAAVERPAPTEPADNAVAPRVVDPAAVAAEPAVAAAPPAAVEPAVATEPAVAVEPAVAAVPPAATERAADLAEPPPAVSATLEGVVPVELVPVAELAAETGAESDPAGEVPATLEPVSPADPAEPLAGVANAAGIVASSGPKSVGSNMGDAQVPEYAESIGAVAHDPDEEALDVPDVVDDVSDVVLLAFAALAAEPAVAFVDAAAVLEFFAPKAAAFAAAPDALAGPALPPWPAVPGSTVGIPNPAGEIGFCAGITAAGGGGVATWTWGAGADAGTLVPGAFDPSGSSVSSNCSSPSRSSDSCSNGALGSEAAVEAASSFSAANRRSGSLVPSRISGSINSSASAAPASRDPSRAVPPDDDGAAPTGTLPSMGASTGRSASGTKTGRDAASIISSLVDASSIAINDSREPVRPKSLARFGSP